MKKVLLISIIILMTGCKATYRDDGREITWLDRVGVALHGFAMMGSPGYRAGQSAQSQINYPNSLTESHLIGIQDEPKDKSGSNQGYGSYRPLFGQQGYSDYFIYGNDRIVRPNGSSLAWIDKQGNVYGYDGNHLGWYENGCIRGHDGGVMAWQRNAKNLGVIPPIPQIPPILSIPKIEPIRPIPSIPPIKPIPKLDWSHYGLD